MCERPKGLLYLALRARSTKLTFCYQALCAEKPIKPVKWQFKPIKTCRQGYIHLVLLPSASTEKPIKPIKCHFKNL